MRDYSVVVCVCPCLCMYTDERGSSWVSEPSACLACFPLHSRGETSFFFRPQFLSGKLRVGEWTHVCMCPCVWIAVRAFACLQAPLSGIQHAWTEDSNHRYEEANDIDWLLCAYKPIASANSSGPRTVRTKTGAAKRLTRRPSDAGPVSVRKKSLFLSAR